MRIPPVEKLRLAAALCLCAAAVLQARAEIQVVITSQSRSNVTLKWTGGDGFFQVQQSRDPWGNVWEDVGLLSTNHNLTLSVDGRATLFRVVQWQANLFVGRLPDGSYVNPSGQILSRIGRSVEFNGRPVDLVRSPDGATVYVKNTTKLMVVDEASWTLRQAAPYPSSGASPHGLVISRDGSHVYATGAANELYDWVVVTNGCLSFSRTISLPDGCAPCGVALSPDGVTAYVCLSISNSLAVVDLAAGLVTRQIKVGIAPWSVAVSRDGTTAYVADLGGRHPLPGDLLDYSAGSALAVDERGIPLSGVVSFVDLLQGVETAEVAVGLQPADVKLSPDGGTLFVANSNSDSVTRIDTQTRTVTETIPVQAATGLPPGTAVSALGLSPDGRLLFVACGGNNAVATFELPNGQHTNSLLLGLIPTDWYPGAVIADSTNLYVANVKGLPWTDYVGTFIGSSQVIAIPTREDLTNRTAGALANARVPEILQTQTPARTGRAPVPVPECVGEPSVFKHVLYIIKENKTYDNMFGDIPSGNGDASLCLFPQSVSPNHHALALQYVLLDNFYCNGVWSVDGHRWATAGSVTAYYEKSFGGYARGDPYDTDPLLRPSSGFIWDNVLRHGLSFRNYGEMVYSFPQPSRTWSQMYSAYTNGLTVPCSMHFSLSALAPYTSTNVPGFNMNIPDVIRAEAFIQEFNAAQSNGFWPAFNILYLPGDHSAGETPGFPTPSAVVADNDLALGRVVEAVTRSIFGTNTVIFVIEDDPMSGLDHVDGHRSICLVISPYTRRHVTLSTFYNQTGMLHTMEQILGIPPMNQMDAMGPLMTDCFTNVADFTPYTALANNLPLDTMNPGTTSSLTARQRRWASQSRKLDFTTPDKVNENTLNRIIWHSVKGDARYPSEFAGPHGKGLKQLGLKHVPTARKDGDDD